MLIAAIDSQGNIRDDSVFTELMKRDTVELKYGRVYLLNGCKSKHVLKLVCFEDFSTDFSTEMKLLAREELMIKILTCSHPNVNQLIACARETGDRRSTDLICFFEYLDSESGWIPMRRTRPITGTMTDKANLLAQIEAAVNHLRSHGIVYSDFHAENLMYNTQTKQVQLIDWVDGDATKLKRLSLIDQLASAQKLVDNFFSVI